MTSIAFGGGIPPGARASMGSDIDARLDTEPMPASTAASRVAQVLRQAGYPPEAGWSLERALVDAARPQPSLR